MPGYLFCDRHIAWSTRKRKPRASTKPKVHGSGVLEPTAIAQEFAEDHGPTQRDAGILGGLSVAQDPAAWRCRRDGRDCTWHCRSDATARA